MSKWHKPSRPVDRALSDISRKIETVERQLRDMGHETRPSAANPLPPVAAEPTPPKSVKTFVRQMLTPPSSRSTAPARNTRQDLFDAAANPMQDLDPDPIAFVPPTAAPDLFAAAQVARPPTAVPADQNLGRYLAAGSFKIPKPTLKRVQRETRNRFFMWLGLSAIVIWLIVVVIR